MAILEEAYPLFETKSLEIPLHDLQCHVLIDDDYPALLVRALEKLLLR